MEDSHNSKIKSQVIGMIVLLIAQYILGMVTNLFVQFPQNAGEGQLWEFAWHQVPLALHIIVGILLLAGSIVVVIQSIQSKNKPWIVASLIAVTAILIAGGAGATFIAKQTNSYSFLMSFAFIISLLSYVWGLYVTKKNK